MIKSTLKQRTLNAVRRYPGRTCTQLAKKMRIKRGLYGYSGLSSTLYKLTLAAAIGRIRNIEGTWTYYTCYGVNSWLRGNKP